MEFLVIIFYANRLDLNLIAIKTRYIDLFN